MSFKDMPKWVKIVGIILIIIIILVLVAGIVATVYINNALNQIERVENTNIESIDSTIASEDIVNILFIGQDRREDEDDNTNTRSDTMMLITYNKTNGTVKLTSFMRDMYVDVPGYGSTRLNHAYAYGGMELLDKTLEENFLISIDGNIEVDFEAFENVIDAIGGVDIDVNAAEAEYLNVTEGTIHMDGELALNYSRIRKIGNGDYERTERQRNVITAVIEKAKSMDIVTLLSLINDTLPYLTTDLTNSDITTLATTIITSGISGVETYRIPIDGGYYSATIDGMAVLVPDLEMNQDVLDDIINGEDSEETE